LSYVPEPATAGNPKS